MAILPALKGDKMKLTQNQTSRLRLLVGPAGALTSGQAAGQYLEAECGEPLPDDIEADWPAAREFFGLDESFLYSDDAVQEYVLAFRRSINKQGAIA